AERLAQLAELAGGQLERRVGVQRAARDVLVLGRVREVADPAGEGLGALAQHLGEQGVCGGRGRLVGEHRREVYPRRARTPPALAPRPATGHVLDEAVLRELAQVIA